jgi:murein DD-endopeptidase MepM/ murein hydrolase activator NlpD
LKLFSFLAFIVLWISFPTILFSQSEGSYPQGYFANPLNIPMSLSGNFGELRPDHYHMGIDIKTQGRVNLPVYASADGYVARIKVEPAGFGQAIYINHPNGYTTLYAHLNSFAPALAAYIKRRQYELQAWNIFIDIPKELFPVRKGEFIANSGSTGGSQAPHVHFEIRRTSDDVNVNPMLFGFPIPDKTRPSLLRLAVYDRTKSVYEQSPKIVPVKSLGAAYQTTPGKIIVSSPKVSFAITSFDTHTGSTNQNGIYQGWLYEDDRAICHFEMDNISYLDTRYLNAHIDYKTKYNRGPFLQQLSELPGYVNSIYKKTAGEGVLDISDGLSHRIRIESTDTYGNKTTLNFEVQYNGTAAAASTASGQMFYPLMIGANEGMDCEFFTGERSLYDSVHIRHAQTLSGLPEVISKINTIGPAYVPLQDSMLVRIKPIAPADPETRSRVVMQMFSGSEKQVQKVEWAGEWASARFRDLGSFQLVVDREAPEILPIGFNNNADLRGASSIMFTCRDNMGKFKRFRAELDGKWLMFSNDKGRTFIYRFDENCPPGQHSLKVSVDDEAGNNTTKYYSFTR